MISMGNFDFEDCPQPVVDFLNACGEISDEHDHGVLIYRTEGQLVIELFPLEVQDDDNG